VKGYVLPRQWSPFLCLTIFSWSPVQWQGYCSWQIWSAPRALFYLASGLLLWKPLFLSLFSYSPWDPSAPSGSVFTLSNKGSNFTPPRGLSLLPPSLRTSRSYSVDWWSDYMVSKNGLSSSNKTQRSLTVYTSKTVSPEAWRMTDFVPIIDSLKKARAINHLL
jgi:hypothetical protein